jgi:hypothetical protein
MSESVNRQSEQNKRLEDAWLAQMKFTENTWDLPDGRKFLINTKSRTNAPKINELRPVVDQVNNRLYVFDSDGEGFLLKDYGNNPKGALRAAGYYWGAPSQETWGHVNRPVPASYDNDTFALIEEFGVDILDKMNIVRCARGCCADPIEAPFNHWRLSELSTGRILARAAIRMSDGDLIQLPDEHVVYVAPTELSGEALEYDRFIRMVQMFGEPFDAVNGQPNPIYFDVLQQYRDGA